MAHHALVEAALLAAAVEIGRVERKRLVHLEPRDAEGHHDIRRRVGLREKILDLLAGADVPFRHACGLHFLLRAVGQTSALSDGLHDLERPLFGHPAFDEVQHDIVAAADGVVDGGGLGQDQIARVAQPHVRAVGEAGQADERVEFCRLRLLQHSAREARAEFRDGDGADRPQNGVVFIAQHLAGREDRHGILIVERDFLRVDAGHVLQHTDHGRVIVAQHIELQEVFLHGVIFKMRRDPFGVLVVRRVLHGAEVPDLVLLRNDDEAAGVLAGRALDVDAAERQPVLLRLGDGLIALRQVFFRVAVGRFFRDGADGARAEDMGLAEHLHTVGVRLGLIFAGEVEVDIRDLVAAEAEKRLKRDIEPVLVELRAALRAHRVRQVCAAGAVGRNLKRRELALRTAVVRRIGIDLRDAGHERHNGRADRASRADKIAVLQRVLHQLLRRHINDVVMAGNNVVHFRVDALLHKLRRGFAVEPVELAVDEGFQVLDGIFNLRREQIVRHGPQRLAPVNDAVRVLDDDLMRLFRAEIGEFLHHLICRAQIQRQRPVGVGHLLGGKQDVAENLILRVEEVHVAGGDDGLSQLLAELDDGAVEAAQFFLVLGKALVEHEAVVADGLDLQKVIEASDTLQLRPAFVVQDCLKQFARLAG